MSIANEDIKKDKEYKIKRNRTIRTKICKRRVSENDGQNCCYAMRIVSFIRMTETHRVKQRQT